MNETERNAEMARFHQTLAEISRQLAQASGSYQESRTELKNTLVNYWDHLGSDVVDEAQVAESIDRQRSISAALYQGQHRLQRMLVSPYFGRIDFRELQPDAAPAPEAIYIGIAALTDPETGQLLVYDWRAPISGMFYDFERGEAWYDCPIGTVSGVITLKRQYKIVDGQMKFMFDADIKIDDEILQEILWKSADDKMHTIVTSIQREQNRIIRNEENKLLVVQGPAGSGKTSIALHRAAYLLYREKDSITSKNILILSPNRIFSDYISDVLPEMGEENVIRTTFRDYAANVNSHLPVMIEERAHHLEYLFSSPDNKKFRTRLAGIRYKSSPEFEALIENYFRYFAKTLVQGYPDLAFRGQIFFSRRDWQSYYLHELAFLPILRRLAKIHQIIQSRMRPLIHALRKEKEAQITAAGEEVNEKVIKAMARLAASEEFHPLFVKIQQLTELDPLILYRRIFEEDALFQTLSRKTSVPPQWPEIRKQTLAFLDGGLIPHEDSFPFLYLQGYLEGFPSAGDIRHVIIDEAQDYTALQYKILKRLFPKCTWTLLGDPAQSLHPYLEVPRLDRVNDILQAEQPEFIRLNRSYRSTREIQEFCHALLPDVEHADPIHRSGRLPDVIQVSNASMLTSLLRQAAEALQKEGWQSIAILTKTDQEAVDIHTVLCKNMEVSLIHREDADFHRGVVVIPSYLAKGLEFDAVLVLHVNADVFGRNSDRHILYTLCTRALHRLILYYDAALSPLVKDVNPHLYQAGVAGQ